jgi:hypothetical protein
MGIEFPQARNEINRRTGRLEASFASKLVATLNPSAPVIDRFVLQNFGLKLPSWSSRDREFRTVDIYRALCIAYESLLNTRQQVLKYGSFLIATFLPQVSRS